VQRNSFKFFERITKCSANCLQLYVADGTDVTTTQLTMSVSIGSRSRITARSGILNRNITASLVCRKSAAAVWVMQITVDGNGFLF
jgi:hypothetical protein